MAGRGLDELGGGKVRAPTWLWLLGLLVPAAAVLAWLYWAELSETFGPTVIPILSPVIPKPEGAPSTAQARYDSEFGVVWHDCRQAAGGQVSAEWRRKAGFYRVWIAPGRDCARPARDDTPDTLRLGPHARPTITLGEGSSGGDRQQQRARCDGAPDASARHLAVARATRGAGADVDGVLGAFVAQAPALRWARPAGETGGVQICTLRDQPPGETGGLNVTMSLGRDRP